MNSKKLSKKKVLFELVHDTELLSLNETESLAYIQKKTGGLKISRSSFYSLKKEAKEKQEKIYSDKLEKHYKIGHVVDYIDQTKSLKLVQDMLIKTMHQETSKPIAQQNLTGISKIAMAIEKIGITLVMQNLGSPYLNFLHRMRHEEYLKKNHKNNVLEVENPSAIPYKIPPSSLILPETERPNGIQTDEELETLHKSDTNRVF